MDSNVIQVRVDFSTQVYAVDEPSGGMLIKRHPVHAPIDVQSILPSYAWSARQDNAIEWIFKGPLEEREKLIQNILHMKLKTC